MLTEEQKAQAALDFVPPDGGRRAWLAVAGGWLGQFCSFGFISALGTFQYVYEKQILRSKTASEISWILTVQIFLLFFLSQPVGVGIDMFGPRPIVVAALIFSVGGLIALSYATEYYQIFLAQSLTFGLGAAGAFVPGLVLAGQYFKKRRALALGVVASGASTGGVVFPTMLARLFDQIGFGPTLRYTSLFIGSLLAIACLIVSPAIPPKGLAGRRSLISLAGFKKPVYLVFVSAAFLFAWGLFIPFGYLPLFATSTPSTSKIGLYTVSILNAASTLGRIFPNMLSDRVGSIKTITVMALLSGITVIVIWIPINYQKSLGGLIVFALAYGFTSGAFVSLLTPALIEVVGGPTSDLGAKIGTLFAIIAIAGLTGLPIQGAIEASSKGGKTEKNVIGLIVFCGIAMLAGGVLLGLDWILIEKQKRKSEDESSNH
ncbi:major facilitator superfamily domain-containing protein [Nemania sp. FL0916]|nr:major facilitator superfamily domain-containing protein [Nemania sp. FL0916]